MPSSPVSDGGSEPAVDEAERVADEAAPEIEAELARVEDRYKRALADLDNYRKRSAREVERRVAERNEQVVKDWLEAVDSVERALQTQGPTNEIAAGLRAVMEQMEAILERQGVVQVGAPGDPFDPELHEAVAVRESDEAPDGTIAEVARSGYVLGDKVLRPAQVVVSRRRREDGDLGNDDSQEEVEG
ncbi:MAG: molecular chaperone GrpE [Solirubrobacterales bacterium]|jgi:molecular chaperone GrpE|nr:molecular chaperone GrpE [Solirubrobacterales bacterium]